MALISTSNTYTTQTTAANRTGISSGDRSLFFEGVTVAATTGHINLIMVPPGRVRVLPKLSGFIMANGAATAEVSIGTAAYQASNGVAVAAVADSLMTAALVNTCVLGSARTIMTMPANGGLLLDSVEGVGITATVTVANTAANGTYSGWITWSYLG